MKQVMKLTNLLTNRETYFLQQDCAVWIGQVIVLVALEFFSFVSSSCMVNMNLGCGQCQRSWSPCFYSSILSSVEFVRVKSVYACNMSTLRISQYLCLRSIIIIVAQKIWHCDYSVLQQKKEWKYVHIIYFTLCMILHISLSFIFFYGRYNYIVED